MKKNSTREDGITLVALVITIVVLLLLTGVIIDINDANIGILNITNQKKQETEILSIKEEIKTFLAENPPDSYESLIATLGNYGSIENGADPENATLKTNKGSYYIPVKDIWNLNSSPGGLEIGDYVKYEPQGASYLVSKDYSGNSSNQTISLSNTDNILWRVFDIDYDTGEIKLVPSENLNIALTISGVNGYNNAAKLLNDICDTLFTDGSKGIKARSLNIEDIEKNATTIEGLKESTNYGSERADTAEETEYGNLYYPQILDEESSESAQSNFVTGFRTLSGLRELKSIQTSYSGDVYPSDAGNQYHEALPEGAYWLASRAININQSIEYQVRTIEKNGDGTSLGTESLYNSSGEEFGPYTYSILPVLIANENMHVTDGDGTEGKPFYIE